MERRDITRRQFLKGTAAGAMGLAAASVLGPGVFASGEPSAGPGGASGGPSGGFAPGVDMELQINYDHLIRHIEDWKIKPDDISESRIKEEYDTQVLIIGGGYAGNAVCLELCEEGYDVILVENQPELTYELRGGDQGVINSKYCQEAWEAPQVDPVEFYNNWMLNCQNYANPALVMKFAKNGGESLDWHISRCTEEQKKLFYVKFWDHDNESVRPHVMDSIGPFKYWAPTLHPEQYTVYRHNRAYCEEQGARYFYNCHAEQSVYRREWRGDRSGCLQQRDRGVFPRQRAIRRDRQRRLRHE